MAAGDLNLVLDKPRALAPHRLERWRELLDRMESAAEGSCLIFLAEMLEMLDPGQPCQFEGGSRYAGDGTGGMRWRLSTANLSIRRVFEQRWQRVWEPEKNDVWDHWEVIQDSTEFEGFDGEISLRWDGKVGDMLRPLHLVLAGIDKQVEPRITALARELYATVEPQHRPFAAAEPKIDKEPSGLPLPPTEGYAVVKLHYSQGSDLWRIVPVAYFNTLIEAEAYFKDHSYDGTDPNGWTDRVERYIVRIQHDRHFDQSNIKRIAAR